MKKFAVYLKFFIFAVIWGVISVLTVETMEMREWLYIVLFAVMFNGGLYAFYVLFVDKEIKKISEENMKNLGDYHVALRKWGFGATDEYPRKEDYGL